MKSLMNKSSYLVLMIAIMASCDVIELDQLNATDDGNSEVVEESLQGPTSTPATRDEVLNLLHAGASKVWEAEGFTIFGMSGFLPCRLDDSMVLSADGTYEYDGGSALCGAEDNTRMVSGTWEVSEDLASITFTQGSETHRAGLIGLTTDQITLTGNYQGLELNAVYTSN